jgi:GTP 3',8-cyclase
MQFLTDTFGRKHDYLRISLTDKCNFRCFYCMPDGPVNCKSTSELMDLHEVYEIASCFVKLGVKKIRLTGGEPLIRKDAAEIIRLLGKLPVELAITTNGVLIDKFIDVFEEAGLKNVNVSLDSLSSKGFAAITGRDVFKKVMYNIRLLLYRGFHVKVNVVVTRDINDDEIYEFINWTLSKNVHVRFIEFMPFSDNRWEMKKVVTYPELIEKISSNFSIRKLTDDPHDTAKSYKVTGAQGTFAVISSVSEPFCQSCNRLRLLADGTLQNCLFSAKRTDLLSAFRDGLDIEPLIRNCVTGKALMQGGNKPGIYSNHGSMVRIGG